MRELFETFSADGRRIGLAPREQVHREGLWHRAVNVFLFRSDGRLLVQRRQITKDVWPGAWDLSVAEHVKPGETYPDAALRGLREELGVDQAELQAIGHVVSSCLEVKDVGIKDYELQQSFRTVFDGEISPCPEEVAEVRFVSSAELTTRFRDHPDRYTPWFRHRAAELGVLSR